VNQGIYREGAAAPGLPLPRTRLGLLTGLVCGIAAVALFMTPMLFLATGHGAAGVWRRMKEGGLGMFWLLLLGFVLPIAIAAAGAFALRGKRVPSGILLAIAALPFGSMLLSTLYYQRVISGALSGESVDPSMAVRIAAEGIAETMALDILGGLVTCGCAIIASIAAASVVASIDVASVQRSTNAPPASSTFTIAAGAAGGVWALASIILTAMRLKTSGGVFTVLELFIVATIVPFAFLAARSAPVLQSWHDSREAMRCAGAILVAGIAAILAVVAFERAHFAIQASSALGAVAGESVDPSQRARILFEVAECARYKPLAYAVHTILGAATFGFVLAPALGKGRHPFAPSAAASAVLALALFGGTMLVGHFRSSLPKTLAERAKVDIPSGVTLPQVPSEQELDFAHPDRVIVVKADGTGVTKSGGDTTDKPCGGKTLAFADRAAKLKAVAGFVGIGDSCAQTVHFAVTQESPSRRELEVRLGEYALFVGPTNGTVQATFGERATPRYSGIVVKSVADDAFEIDGRRITLPGDSDGDRNFMAPSRIDQIRYVFRADDTVGHAIDAVVVVQKLYGHRTRGYDTRQFFEFDTPAPPPGFANDIGDGIGLGNVGGVTTGTKAPKIRVGATQVNGRLPPEVIQRIVRQNTGRFRLCYENGLRKDPKLRGRVAVRFVIDRSGSVATAQDGGSDLPNAEVVACVVRAFGNLSFPQPEGGIVTVVYPLIFEPAE
jgi:hypothetical protein